MCSDMRRIKDSAVRRRPAAGLRRAVKFVGCLLLAFVLMSSMSACLAQESVMPDPALLARASLVRVIDGDTAVFNAGNVILTVRLIGVNAPEDGTLYSNNSTDYLKSALAEQTVFLENGAEPLDDYGRFLAYVWMEDGSLLNAALLRDGAAAICFFPPNVKYAKELTDAQAAALDEGIGMWAVYARSDLGETEEIAQYIGNKNSKALHKPTCSGLPSEKNRVYFTSYEDAISSGYHECQKCFK